jgi:SagB-type dehydrogenase family enzyme
VEEYPVTPGSAAATTPQESLPAPESAGGLAFHQVLTLRRSCRQFLERPLTAGQIAQLCWSGQGITSGEGFRTAPSAGALYPIVLYVVDERGVFEYLPETHHLARRLSDDVRGRLQRAALGQEYVGNAPVCLVIAFDSARLSARYGRRSERYCWLEAGHVAQNILLQATSLHLAAVPVGAFHDGDVAATLQFPPRLQPAYLLPAGYPTGE